MRTFSVGKFELESSSVMNKSRDVSAWSWEAAPMKAGGAERKGVESSHGSKETPCSCPGCFPFF